MQCIPQLLYLMDFMYYCIYSYHFKNYIYCHILALFAFGKFLLLRHVIYENVVQRNQQCDQVTSCLYSFTY